MNYHHLSGMARPGAEWSWRSPKEQLQYAVGALLYAPAIHAGVKDSILLKRYQALTSIVFCLEDAILDAQVPAAERTLAKVLSEIHAAWQQGALAERDLPLLCIRVRQAEQIPRLLASLGSSAEILTSFVLPKFDSGNATPYLDAFLAAKANTPFSGYLMPIIESERVMQKDTRLDELLAIRAALGQLPEHVLNVRVGGNDFCRMFGLRRSRTQSIYDVAVVCDVLVDILQMLGQEHIISAPVWEYFGEEDDSAWRRGLQNEVALDRLNGFVGKTAIHPVQLEAIQQGYAVEPGDYADALAVLDWQSDMGVGKTQETLRMNEVKVHERWARKIMSLAQIYGVKQSNEGHH